MPTGVRKCKVCGKEYPYCRSIRAEGVFKYQDVACCPDHGEIYLARVLEARGMKKKDEADTNAVEEEAAPKAAKKTRKVKKATAPAADGPEEMA